MLIRRLICLALVASLLLPAVDPAFAAVGRKPAILPGFDLDTLRFPLKIFDIVPSAWSAAKKAELSAALDVACAAQDASATPWWNVVGHIRDFRKVNAERKEFMVETKKRVTLENQLNARPFHADLGLHAYKGLLKVADTLGTIDGTGPIFSQLNTRYNSLVTLLIQRDRTSVFNLPKRMSLMSQIRREVAEIYQLSKRFKDSNLLRVANAIMKGKDSSGGKPGKESTLDKIVRFGTIIGGVAVIAGGIWKLTQSSKSSGSSSARRIGDTRLAPAYAPAEAAAAADAPEAAADPNRLRSLMERYRLEAGKASPDAATLRDLQRQMETARERK